MKLRKQNFMLAMTILRLLIPFIILMNVDFARAKRECLSVKYSDFSDCAPLSLTNQQKGINKSSIGKEKCFYEDVCNKTFRLAQINYYPVSSKMLHFIKTMLSECCGACAKLIVESLKDNSKLNKTTIDNTDIIFPIFSYSSTRKIHGYWYIPLVEVPNAYYFQEAPTPKNAMDIMLKDFRNLWPLLLICFVFALGAGLFIWLLDTWGNREEFPREFLIGWFEGFWWSFISMTTVGYGDKAPKSRLARLFSIGWILIGITIFSMLTASLSTIITNAEKPPSVDITGKRIGALKDRVYDATVIAKHGGRVRIFPYDNLTHGIDKLIDALFSNNNTLDGFLLDKFAYMAYCDVECGRLNKTFRSEKKLSEKYAFGALVRGENEFNYLAAYVKYNWFYFDTCHEIGFNEMSTRLISDQKIVVFSHDGSIFQPIIIGFCATIALVFLLGVIITYLKKDIKKKKNTTEEVEMN